jgi:hypothetical protein
MKKGKFKSGDLIISPDGTFGGIILENITPQHWVREQKAERVNVYVTHDEIYPAYKHKAQMVVLDYNTKWTHQRGQDGT